jgi:tRNA/tmRNA/rRNA uracil-C5-methylase (TrmA/RlmC/RlmD family)
MAGPRPGARIRAEFSELSHDRSAVAHCGSWTVAVPDAVPGDIAEIELREQRGADYRGYLLTLIRPSPFRVRPLCPIFDRCGGCQWQRVDTSAQAEHKTALVQRALRSAGLSHVPVRAIPAAIAWEYRTAGTYVPVRAGRPPALGLHPAAGPSPVAVGECVVQSPILQAAFQQTQRAWQTLEPRLRNGAARPRCRQVRIRVGEASQEAGIGLVLETSPTPQQRDAIVGELRTHVARVVEIAAMAAPVPLQSAATATHLRWGRPGAVEAMLGFWYEASVFAPFPDTSRAAPDAITAVIDALALDEKTTLLETDAGIGVYTLPAAAAARRVIGRTAPEHLAAARHNAAWNDASNAMFVDRASHSVAATIRSHGPIQTALVQLVQDTAPFDALYDGGIDHVVLVTSSPTRLASALTAADAAGFRPHFATVIDTHPQTSRAEVHAVLSARRRAWGGTKLRAMDGGAASVSKPRRAEDVSGWRGSGAQS